MIFPRRLLDLRHRAIANGLLFVGAFAGLAIPSLPATTRASDKPEVSTSSDLAIRINSVGYLPQAEKLATVAGECDNFVIRDARTGSEVLRGSAEALVAGEDSVGPLYVADFSELKEPGTYQLEVPGIGVTPNFQIREDLYNWPLYTALRGMYLWRCGTSVSGEFGGNKFHHADCHMDDAYLDHAGGAQGERRDGVGGWHDAGDYNKYIVNAGFTVGMMLQAWEHFQEQLAPLNFDLPESSNQIPDYLDEIRWELDWMLKMQADDGRVYHKLSTLDFGGFVPPEEEQTRRFLSPWGSAATADFVAVMAQAARVFKPYDEAFAGRCLAAAEKSYKFLQAHPEDHHPDQSAFKTGPYDTPDDDDRLWAAAELWETTGEQQYLADVERRIQAVGDGTNAVQGDWDWNSVRNLGLFTYVLSSREGRNPAVLARVRKDTLQTADEIVAKSQQDPYGRPLEAYYWGCNGTVARLAMNLNVADRLSSDPKYRAAMVDALNYVFGRNPYGRSFITGLGASPPLFPHDRRSGGDKVAAPWPGYLVGGPWPKPLDWRDDQENYNTNEVAINWNGALIYALAAFAQPASFDESVGEAQRSAAETAPEGE